MVIVFGEVGEFEVGLYYCQKAFWDKSLGPDESVVLLEEAVGNPHNFGIEEPGEFFGNIQAIFEGRV